MRKVRAAPDLADSVAVTRRTSLCAVTMLRAGLRIGGAILLFEALFCGSALGWNSSEAEPQELFPVLLPWAGERSSGQCARDSASLREAAANGTLWAARMVDSCGRVHGALWGQRHHLGSFESCVAAGPVSAVGARYCLVDVVLRQRGPQQQQQQAPHRWSHVAELPADASVGLALTGRGQLRSFWVPGAVRVAVCAPSSCGAAQLQAGLRAQVQSLRGHPLHHHLQLSIRVDPQLCTDSAEVQAAAPLQAKLFWYGLAVLTGLTFAAPYKCWRHWDWRRHWAALAAPAPRGAAALSGIRCIGTVFLVLAHRAALTMSFSFTSSSARDPIISEQFRSSLPYAPVAQSYVNVNTFLFLSGIMAAGAAAKRSRVEAILTRLARVRPSSSLFVGAVDASLLLPPMQAPVFPEAVVTPSDPQTLVPVLSGPIAVSRIDTDVGMIRKADNKGDNVAEDLQRSDVSQTFFTGEFQIADSGLSPAICAPLHIETVLPEFTMFRAPPPPFQPQYNPGIFHQIQGKSMIISIDRCQELEWLHFLHHESASVTDVGRDVDSDVEEDAAIESEPSGSGEHSNSNISGSPIPTRSSRALYDGCPSSVHDSIVSILAYALKEHLSGQAFSRLLLLIDNLLPQPNNLPKTLVQFYKYFDHTASELDIYYFCGLCWKPILSARDACSECKDNKRKAKYFITAPLVPQLKKLYSRPGFSNKLKYKYNRQRVSEDSIEDVYDGSLYKTVESVLQNTLNVSFSWYTDGISLYESSSYSLWPFVLVINELSPEERFKPENLILAGLWGCSDKPHPNVFLLPIYQEITQLSQGFNVRLHGCEEDVTVKGYLLTGSCDVPAKAAFMNMKGHAGYYSCPRCLIKGEKSAATGNVMVFPHQSVLELRSEQHYAECVRESVKSKDGYLGVNGPTILYYMTFGSFLISIYIDAMHSIYIGLTKQLLNLWFSSTYSSEKFSMSEKVDVINSRLSALKLPHFVQRATETVDKLWVWKASLLRNFLLYMALPVMKGIMPDDVYYNLSLLVTGISLLNSQSISLSDLDMAQDYLCRFSEDFQRIYGKRHMSSNLHLTRHLVDAVRETGPLWVTSCFKLEDFNGQLTLLAHGTTHASLQIFKQFFILSELKVNIEKLKSSALKVFCENLTNQKKALCVGDKVCSGTYVVGTYGHDSKYSRRIEEFLENMFLTPFNFQTFARLYRNKQLYVSRSYERGLCVSYYCRYKISDTEQCHGVILVFVKTFPNDNYFGLISRSVVERSSIDRYILDSNTDITYDFVPVTNLECVCFCINVGDQKYIVDPLNAFELE